MPLFCSPSTCLPAFLISSSAALHLFPLSFCHSPRRCRLRLRLSLPRVMRLTSNGRRRARARALCDCQKTRREKQKTNRKNCNLFEIYDEKMNTVAFLNILIIRPESLRQESRRAFFRHRRLPLEPVARQSRDRRLQTEFKPRFFANFDCILFLAFLYIFYFWGICRVINKFATLPQDICIRNYGNEML